MKFFTRVPFSRFFLEKIIFDLLQKMQGEMLLLYEFSRGNQVDGSPRVANEKHVFECDCFANYALEFNNKLKLCIDDLDGDS